MITRDFTYLVKFLLNIKNAYIYPIYIYAQPLPIRHNSRAEKNHCNFSF